MVTTTGGAGMTQLIEFFHFLRPWWLLGLLHVAFLWWSIRPRSQRTSDQHAAFAPHLAKALEVGTTHARRFYPIDLFAIVGALLCLAVAGPSWNRIPNPLVAETAPLVVALKVTESMESPDLAPSRLDRAKYKILDLIESRAGARTALIAYAGSAHQVAPLTEDPNILKPLLSGLTPKVMPVEGADATDALALALEVLDESETGGAILFALDDLGPADIAALNAEDSASRPPIVFLQVLPDGNDLPQLAQITNSSTVQITPDDSDIARIERQLRSLQQAALADDDRLQWQDRAWWLAWPVALLVALWFRRGWTMRWAAIILALGLTQAPSAAHAGGWKDWFLTPDQQGYLAFEDKRFADAGELFEDPMWRGYAKYRAGQYEGAIEIFQRLDSADAAFNQGLAEIKNRQYRPAVRSFETALTRQPDFPEAQHNLEVAKAIVDYVETTREQSDTGEEAGIGADDIVFDNEAARGADTEIEATHEDTAPQTADQWIDSINTGMEDFLRGRFLADNARAAQ